MKASRSWGPCNCNCGKNIMPGDEIAMFEGGMYLKGHQFNRRTRQMPVIPTDDEPPRSRKK